MKIKFTVMAFFAIFQAVVTSNALAWSPLDIYESAVESMRQCHTVVAGSDENQDGQKKEEEEEEPDCD